MLLKDAFPHINVGMWPNNVNEVATTSPSVEIDELSMAAPMVEVQIINTSIQQEPL